MNQNQNNRRNRQRSHSHRPHSSNNGGENRRSDVKVGGNAKQQLDKYKSLARDAAQSGDYALSENYFQHADHYHRILNERQEKSSLHNDNKNHSKHPNNKVKNNDNSASDEQKNKVSEEGVTAAKVEKVKELVVNGKSNEEEKPKMIRKKAIRKPRTKEAETAE